jgi:putative nucleotidyltransferase with HDIG domain
VKTAVAFLTSLARVLAAGRIYAHGHPARDAALRESFDRLEQLLEEDPAPRFTTLEGELLYHRHVITEFRDSEWTRKLEQAGIRRIEVQRGVVRDEFERFVQEISGRMAGTGTSATAPQFAPTHIRYGGVAVPERAPASGSGRDTALHPPYLGDEVAALRWVHEEVEAGRAVPMLEAETVVRCLTMAMHRERHMVLPLLELRTFDEYTTTHANNVAVLTMALSESLGYAAAEVRALGVTGLLHDIGKTRIPKDVLTKPGALTPSERAVIQQHTVEGAKILLARESRLDLAAVVAYEHHMLIDGGGYPVLRVPRSSHFASQIVHVCDVFDALCTDRPYRPAWSIERALGEIESGSGTQYIPELVQVFGTMVRSAVHARTTLRQMLADAGVAAAGAAPERPPLDEPAPQ